MPVAAHYSASSIVLWIVLALVVLVVLTAVIGRALVRRGLREPFVVRIINRLSGRLVEGIKRPLTIAVLEEVADVLRAGHYTRNIASALRENREEIKQMVAEKIKDDPTAGAINFVPFHDRIIEQASEATLRVILEVLADPRTDELVNDMLRENINQLGEALRHQQEEVIQAGLDPPPDAAGT